jgi:hypothetical protein
MTTSLDAYAEDLIQEVISFSEANSTSTHDAFVEHALSSLEAAGHIADWSIGYYRSRGIEISGYGLNDDLGTLDIFVAQFRQQPLLTKIGKTDLTALAKRAVGFAAKAQDGLAKQLDKATEAHDAAQAVADALKSATGVRVFILTNEVSTVRTIGSITGLGDLPITLEIWDLQRLHRLETSGRLHEPIAVTFSDPLPCLSTPTTDDNYSVFLTIIRGDVLGEIYHDYGTRLLELNVRSFLQLKGAVNRGIRETLIHMPERFLAYNNGISATASKVEWRDLGGGVSGIRRIHDLQIVNGGQTTASIHSSLMKKDTDLTKVFVQMKLTVVDPSHLQEVVPEISRFSNTQNKVTVVDFSSNDPYHVELEKLTRTLWAPAIGGSGQETKWFYERARGQYADALSRERTPARQRAFKVQYPYKQKFLKTDVAKWEHSWQQAPWMVSRGAEKNFRAFMAELDGATPTSDVGYVRQLLAKGILFRSTEKIVTEQAFGGYRANIVTYSIAKLAQTTKQRLDLERIWRDQYLSDATADAIAEISRVVNKIITQPSGGTHVGEWTKKEACWARVSDADWSMPAALAAELVSAKQHAKTASGPSSGGAAAADPEAAERVIAVAAETWFELSHWARETSSLEPWQRGLAYSLGRIAARGGEPSPKQAKHGIVILDEALALGFRA